MTASVKSPRIALDKNFLKDVDLNLDNRDSSLNASLACSSVSVSGINLLNDNLMLYAKGDSFGAGLTYDNSTEPANKGEFYLTGKLGRTGDGKLTVDATTLPSYIWYDDAAWSVSESAINMIGKDVRIDNLTASCANQSVNVNGGYSYTKKTRFPSTS